MSNEYPVYDAVTRHGNLLESMRTLLQKARKYELTPFVNWVAGWAFSPGPVSCDVQSGYIGSHTDYIPPEYPVCWCEFRSLDPDAVGQPGEFVGVLVIEADPELVEKIAEQAFDKLGYDFGDTTGNFYIGLAFGFDETGPVRFCGRSLFTVNGSGDIRSIVVTQEKDGEVDAESGLPTAYATGPTATAPPNGADDEKSRTGMAVQALVHAAFSAWRAVYQGYAISRPCQRGFRFEWLSDVRPGSGKVPEVTPTFSRFLSDAVRWRAGWLEWAYRNNVLRLARVPMPTADDPHLCGWTASIHPVVGGNVRETYRKSVENLKHSGSADRNAEVTSEFVLQGLIGGGPKVVRLTANECEVLAQAELRIPWELYRQPFPTVVFEVDPAWARLHQFENATRSGRPLAVIVRHDQKNDIIASIMPCAGQFEITRLMVRNDGLGDMEDTLLRELAGLDGGKGLTGRDLSMSEKIVSRMLMRIAVNAAHLMATTGAVKIGESNANYAAKLAKRIKKAKNVSAEVREQNRVELLSLPVVYSFDQRVVCYESAGPPEDSEAVSDSQDNGPGELTGRHVRPHHRRGHWAWLHTLSGNGTHERNERGETVPGGRMDLRHRFRPHVFINKHLFGGRMADARATLVNRTKPVSVEATR